MTTTLKKISGVYHVKVPANGKSKYISTGCDTKPEAQRVLAESGVDKLSQAAKAGRLTTKVIGQILTGKNLTSAKALEAFKRQMALSRSGNTISNYVLIVSKWLEDLRLETLPPSALTEQHIDRWINNAESTLKRASRVAHLAAIKTFFDFCANKGWIFANPSRLVSVDYSIMSHEQKESSERQPFSEAEMKLLLAELRKDWKLAATGKHTLFQNPLDVLFWLVAVAVSRETGLRLGDIACLEFKSFQEAGKLVIWTAKSNKRIELPLTEATQDLISEVPLTNPDYIFPKQRATVQDPKLRATLSTQFSRLCQRLDIKGKSFHSIRHFHASSAYAKLNKKELAAKLASVLSLEQIATLLGHSHSNTTKGYIHE